MARYDWQEQLRKRRKRTKYERIATLLLIVFIASFALWHIFYADTPEYAAEKLVSAVSNHDTAEVQQYCNLDRVCSHVYDDLTRDMFIADKTLSDDTKVMFEQFYVKVKPQILEETKPLLLSYIADGNWPVPGGSNVLKGRQLGVDYEYLVERSQLRNLEFMELESVTRTDLTAIARIQVKDTYTGTLYSLNLLLEQGEDNWQVTKIINYRELLDFLYPIQRAGTLEYVQATQSVIDKYNDILDIQQTNFKKMIVTKNGTLTKDQRTKLSAYIQSDIVPALEKRQQELDTVTVNDGAQYIAKLRQQETQLSLSQWQHFLAGIANDDLTELNQAKAYHQQALDVQHRIDDILKNAAVNQMAKSIP